MFIYEEEQKDGRILRGLRFKISIYMNGRNVLGVDWDNESTDDVISCNRSKDGDYPATIMVNGTLYYSTDNIVSVNLEENDIQYTMSFAENGVPQKNGETKRKT